MAKPQNTTSGEASLTKTAVVAVIAIGLLFGGMRGVMSASFWDDLIVLVEE